MVFVMSVNIAVPSPIMCPAPTGDTTLYSVVDRYSFPTENESL